MTQPSHSATDKHSWHLAGPAETDAVARWFATHLGSGDVLLLEGRIGAGKTHFARALIRALQAACGTEPEEVPSPTYTLVQTYRAGKLEIWHADLYRLSEPDELAELGLESAFEQGLCLIEWPERLGDLRPREYLGLEFETLDYAECRAIAFQPCGKRAELLAAAAEAWLKARTRAPTQ